MEITPSQLKILLTGTNLLNAAQFEDVKAKAATKQVPLIEYLPQSGVITDNHLGQVIANSMRLNFADLSVERIEDADLQIIPEVVARSQRAVVFKADDEVLHIGTSNPGNYQFIKLLERKTGKNTKVYYSTPTGVRDALRYYRSGYRSRIKSLIQELQVNFKEQDVVTLVNSLMEYAHASHSSDIHIEPLDKTVSVRFRVDGVLHEVVEYPSKLHPKVVFRIKIMSRLRTDERAAPQDGRFTFENITIGPDEEEIKESFDVRVSLLPITDGENVVMRLLSENSQRLTLTDIGLSARDFEKVQNASRKPYGMVLTVGPTGAGKTTTLYAVLHTLNNPKVNIMTIEDPVEYDVEHVQQTQVNPKKNLTFATGLRSIVRQDPDIVMVGEIRDNETAGIAVNAAMTGHLVLSTLHTNDASTTFPRLADMSIEPFLIASSVNVVIAQRLIRNICDKCRTSYFLGSDELKLLEIDPELNKIVKNVAGKKDAKKIRFYKGGGCHVCSGTGYSGRSGIFEVMEVTESLRALISQKSSSQDITLQARKEGMTTMLEDGVAKMFKGVTTLEEVIRAVKS